jgi:hypothetical protein
VSPSMVPMIRPCTRRKPISMARLVDSPQPMVVTTYPVMIPTKRSRLPSTPPSHPSRGITSVRASRKPVATHWVVARSVPKAAMRRGITRLTLVLAELCVAPATRTMLATIHL